MPRVTSFARQRVKLGMGGRTNAVAVRRYRRSKVPHRMYRRAISRRPYARFRDLVRRRILPGVRRRIAYAGRKAMIPASAMYSPRRSRSTWAKRNKQFL